MSDLDKLLEQEQPTEANLKEQINDAVRRLKNLIDEKQTDFSHTDFYYELLHFIGPFPPIKLIEDILTHYKQVKQKIVADELPALLLGAGLSKITTIDGVQVTVKKEISAKALNEHALEWLESQGYGPEIKEKIEFQKGEIDTDFFNWMDGQGLSYKRNTNINFQTLSRIIRNRVEKGEVMPPESAIKVSIIDIAKIK